MLMKIVADPGTSLANRTGAWRTGKRPQFLQTNCIACDMCATICPEHCITGKGKNTYNAHFDYCKGCGNCAAVCPADDIEMVPEEVS